LEEWMARDKKRLVVALDGPAGVGKSTVAIAVARELGLAYVETGALYRAVAYLAAQRGVECSDPEGLAEVARRMDVSFRLEGADNKVFLDGKDVTQDLHTRKMGSLASLVSAVPAVRSALLDVQRSFADKGGGAVAEGRDIGTVVFPSADFKFFLTAEPVQRVERRRKQLASMGMEADSAALSRELAERDKQDSSRAVAPLCAAGDAVIIDTTSLTADAVIRRILAHIRGSRPSG